MSRSFETELANLKAAYQYELSEKDNLIHQLQRDNEQLKKNQLETSFVQERFVNPNYQPQFVPTTYNPYTDPLLYQNYSNVFPPRTEEEEQQLQSQDKPSRLSQSISSFGNVLKETGKLGAHLGSGVLSLLKGAFDFSTATISKINNALEKNLFNNNNLKEIEEDAEATNKELDFKINYLEKQKINASWEEAEPITETINSLKKQKAELNQYVSRYRNAYEQSTIKDSSVNSAETLEDFPKAHVTKISPMTFPEKKPEKPLFNPSASAFFPQKEEQKIDKPLSKSQVMTEKPKPERPLAQSSIMTRSKGEADLGRVEQETFISPKGDELFTYKEYNIAGKQYKPKDFFLRVLKNTGQTGKDAQIFKQALQNAFPKRSFTKGSDYARFVRDELTDMLKDDTKVALAMKVLIDSGPVYSDFKNIYNNDYKHLLKNK
jgi:hypothetical protein